MNEIKRLSEEFINRRITEEYYLYHLMEHIALMKRNNSSVVRLAQALFFIAPDGGDG